jgi:serine/threonine protein kinase
MPHPQILNGLQAIHGCNVLHRDLKSSNILLSRTTREVRLCDFGVSVDLNNLDAKAKKFIFGSAGSQAPEVLSKKAQQGTGVDIWGVGIVWWEMLLGRHPYPEVSVHHHARLQQCSE